ncbi:transposable element Tcb2 transposase [Trichonephila clavipes]|nr:transposable element Tcb2 transposase [Trichonephila clavipes]
MWLYYCKLRGANDFESVNQLIVADKMFEMLDSETATHIGVLQGEEWYKPRDLGKQCDIFYASKGKSYDEPERAKWNDSEKRSFNGSWGQVTEIKKFACFICRSDKHFKRDCPKNKEVDNKRLNVNKVSTEGTKLVDGTVAARVDLLGKVIPRGAVEDKLSKLVKTTSISVDGKLVHALVDSGKEITVIKKDLVPGISVEGASTIYLKGIFGPAVKCPLVYVPIGLATGGQVNVVHQQVLCALAEVLVEDVLLPPEVLDMLGGAQSEENSLAQSSQDLRVDSGNVDETEVSLGILPEKAQEHIEDSQRNITSCRNEVGTLGTKDEEVTAEMDKGIMVADSFHSEQECCAKDKILGESIGQLGLRANVKKFCESCKECQLTRSVRIKDRSPITPVARSELPFQVVNMDLIGPIDPPSSKGHTDILCLVDQHTRWGEARPVTSLSAKVLRMLEQFVVSRIVDIDILMQIWKNRLKQSNCVLEWTTSGCFYKRSNHWEKLEEGRSVTSVAAEFGIAHSIVSRLWRQFQTTGTAIRGFRSGRPRGTTPADDRYIVLHARRNRRQTAGEIARHTTQATGRPISRFTVARRLHGGGLFARRPVRCVPLTRSLWCREHRNWRDNKWGRVLFTDESRFSLSSDSHCILIWRERGSRNHPSNIIERDRGAMGLQFLFMDDNAPCHRTVAAEQLLESEDIERMDWPARSPDLNPIEHVWDFLGRRLAARSLPPVTIRELRLALQDEWAAMPQQLIDTLILSMGRRCETCLAVRGNHIPY